MFLIYLLTYLFVIFPRRISRYLWAQTPNPHSERVLAPENIRKTAYQASSQLSIKSNITIILQDGAKKTNEDDEAARSGRRYHSISRAIVPGKRLFLEESDGGDGGEFSP